MDFGVKGEKCNIDIGMSVESDVSMGGITYSIKQHRVPGSSSRLISFPRPQNNHTLYARSS
jgi:hypothetical protein